MDGSPATAGEPPTLDGAPPTPAAAVSDAGSPAASDDPAKRAEERRQRLEAFKARERAHVEEKQRQTAHERMQADLAAAQKRAEEAERAAQSRLDRALLKDPIAVLAELEREGVPADAVANAIRERLTNPAIEATRSAREALSPELVAMKKHAEALEQRLAAFEAMHAEQQSRVEEERQTNQFLGLVKQHAERAPLAARLLETDREEFLQIAQIAAERVPGMGWEALLDAVEDAIDTEVRGIATKYGALFGAPQPSRPTAPTPPPRAAAKANTVTNSLASGRTAIVDEERDWAELPFEERLARLSRSA